MNATEIITHLRSRKAVINVHDGRLKIRALETIMTPEIITDIKTHKSEIINYLKAANQPRRYVYRYEFKDGKGAGTWITDTSPDKAESEFLKRFSGYELKVLVLIN